VVGSAVRGSWWEPRSLTSTGDDWAGTSRRWREPVSVRNSIDSIVLLRTSAEPAPNVAESDLILADSISTCKEGATCHQSPTFREPRMTPGRMVRVGARLVSCSGWKMRKPLAPLS
jgi:hypothetical protein